MSHVLEVVDATGTPRVRMQAPYLIERTGRVVAARVNVEGCAFDASPLPPWNRHPTPPGATECLVRISWSRPGVRVDYPAVLDPTWTTATSAMTVPRRAHTATLLSDGRVLVVGGERSAAGGAVTHHTSAELFDPATDTFAATGSLSVARSHHAAVRLGDGTVLIAGGSNATPALAPAERWDPTTGQFTAAGTLGDARRDAGLAVRPSGDALVSGGTDVDGNTLRSTEFFDATTGRWSRAQQMSSARSEHALVLLSLGQLLAVGGISTKGVLDLTSCEEFGSAATWSRTGSLNEARHAFATAILSPTAVLVAGGQPAVGASTSRTAELYDSTTRTWSRTGSLAESRAYATLTPTGNGSAVAAGGAALDAAGVATSVRGTTEVFRPESGEWAPLSDLADPRYQHTGTLLLDGRVLLAGGEGEAATLATAELLELDDVGAACTSLATCKSGFCVDGVCCESACDSTCLACSRAATGGSDGTCADVQANLDPRGDCADDGAPACGLNGLCDGAGACDRYAGPG
ncbi:MAG: hypothetical protein FJ090_23110, partial [Deltaproteobacteria bacterium]|nr:hypothetical protein [Deltaproteobacteria bacterium]